MKTEFSIPVEDVFLLKGRGLIIPTHLPVLPDFRPFRERVIVERPDWTELRIEALFTVDHFHLHDGKDEQVLVLEFSAGSEEAIPAGSRILIDPQTAAIWSGSQADK